MTSLVKSRPNHYETLGIEPHSSAGQIREAFTRKMSLFDFARPDIAAQLCIAHETLRDPVKRREHDHQLGLASKAQPKPAQWSYAITQARWSPLTAAAGANSFRNDTGAAIRASEGRVTAAQAQAAVDPRRASIARSVRELASPVVADVGTKSGRRPMSRPQRGADLSFEEVVEHIRAVGRMEKTDLYERGHGLIEWKRPVLTLAGLLAAAGICGAVAGLSLTGDEAPAQLVDPKPASPVRHPPKPVDLSQTAAGLAGWSPALPATRPAPSSRPGPRKHHRAPAVEPDMSQTAQGDASAQTDPLAPVPPEVDPAQPIASLPLSPALIARTIERIGYRCGSIRSASPLDGGARGSFQLTCSSGNSYRATAVGGRYHFRRMG